MSDQERVVIVAVVGALLLGVLLALMTPLPKPEIRVTPDSEAPAAWEVSQLIEEAKRITKEATE